MAPRQSPLTVDWRVGLKPKGIWVVRAGEGGEYADDCKEHNIVALRWQEMGDLSGLEGRDEFLQKAQSVYPNHKLGRQRSGASQLFRFVNEVRTGDLVLTPVSAARQIHMGEIVGEYVHRVDLIEGLPQTRAVEWRRTVSRDDLSVRARNSAGSSLTLFSMAAHLVELLQLLEGGAGATEVSPSDEPTPDEPDFFEDVKARAAELISDRIAHMDPYDFQDLVAALLRATGYHTRVSPPGADRGVDILAYPDPLGFETPRIRAQVKQRSGKRLGGGEMRNFLATLRDGERGLVVSTGGFSPDAKMEAERVARGIAVTMLDLEQFVDLLTQHYGGLESTAKVLMPLEAVYIPVETA